MYSDEQMPQLPEELSLSSKCGGPSIVCEWGALLDMESRKEGREFVNLTREYRCFSYKQCQCPEEKSGKKPPFL